MTTLTRQEKEAVIMEENKKIKETIGSVSLYKKVLFEEIPKSRLKKQLYKEYFILQSSRKGEIVPCIMEGDNLLFGTIDKPVYNSYCLFNTNSSEGFKIIYCMKSYNDVFKNGGNIGDVPKKEWTPIGELINVYRIYN